MKLKYLGLNRQGQKERIKTPPRAEKGTSECSIYEDLFCSYKITLNFLKEYLILILLLLLSV